MPGKTFTVLVGLCFAVMLLLGGLSPTTPGVAAQGAVMEQEPNDHRAQAQRLDLAPGGTVVVDGSVAPGDSGSRVEELSRLEVAALVADDLQEDWFVIDVNRALEFSLELSWPGAANLDTWTFADISEQTFSDGLVSHHLAATRTDQPEREPNRIYYTYADRRAEVVDGPLTIPETSPYYLTVSAVNDGPSPPVTYRLTLTSPAPGTTRSVIYDTSGPGLYAPVFPSDLGARRLLALQRITPPEYPARLDRVDLLQFNLGGRNQVGATLTLVVLVDPQGAGNPANATEVLRRRVRIRALDAINGYPVQDANITVQSGDIYAGFEILEQFIADLHLPFDVDKAGFGRSFVSTDRGASFGVLKSASPDVGIPLVANAGIDAVLTINPTAETPAATSRQAVIVRKTTDKATRAVKSLSVVKP